MSKNNSKKAIEGLNVKQSTALRHYLLTGEKQQAAIKAGYSKKTAASQMTRLLKNAKAKAWLAEQRGQAEKESQFELQDVVNQLGRMAFVDPSELILDCGAPKPLSDWPEAARLAVQSISVTTVGNKDTEVGQVLNVRFADRNQASDKLMKFLGGYEKDNHQRGLASASNDELHAALGQKLLALEAGGVDLSKLLARGGQNK